MERARKVALLGSSVVASSLASTLRKRSGLDILQFAATPQAVERLLESSPDAVILCDLATTSPCLIFPLLGKHPGLLIIGVDVDADRMVVLSGRQSSLRTEDDLLEALRPPAGRDEQLAAG